MRKLILGGLVAATIIAASIAIFIGCQKETRSTAEVQNTTNAIHKWYYYDGFVAYYDGALHTYINDGSCPVAPYDFNASRYWIYIYDAHGNIVGKKWFYWSSSTGPGPGTGIPVKPPMGEEGILYVHEVITNMINATIAQRRELVIAFENDHTGSYDIRLSNVIDAEMLDNVISGAYIISDITETVSTDGTTIMYEYEILFYSPGEELEVTYSVPFVYHY